MVIQSVEPWLSEKDVAAGDRWSLEIAKELEASQFGIIFLTRENLHAPWILFESGALSKALASGTVCPYLVDLDFSDISGPLSQFQAKKSGKSATLEIIQAINTRLAKPLESSRLDSIFDALWPQLEQRLLKLPPAPSSNGKAQRPQQEVLEELVAAIRGLEHRFASLEAKIAAVRSGANRYIKISAKSDIGKLSKGRTIRVAVGDQNFADSVAKIVGVDINGFGHEWYLYDPSKSRYIVLDDCDDILAYFDGRDALLELDDNDIPF
jgi:hypothetical protein